MGEHQGRFAAGGWLWYVGGICAVGSVVQLGKAALGLIAGTPDALGLLGSAAFAAALGAAVLAVALLRWRQSIVVYERGLVHTRLVGSRELAFDEVQRTQLRGVPGAIDSLEVFMRDGRVLAFRGVTHIEQLAAMIRSGSH